MGEKKAYLINGVGLLCGPYVKEWIKILLYQLAHSSNLSESRTQQENPDNWSNKRESGKSLKLIDIRGNLNFLSRLAVA